MMIQCYYELSLFENGRFTAFIWGKKNKNSENYPPKKIKNLTFYFSCANKDIMIKKNKINRKRRIRCLS